METVLNQNGAIFSRVFYFAYNARHFRLLSFHLTSTHLVMEGTASPEMSSGLRTVIHPNTESPEGQYPFGTEHYPINTPSESGSPATTIQPIGLESDSIEQGQMEGLDESYKLSLIHI